MEFEKANGLSFPDHYSYCNARIYKASVRNQSFHIFIAHCYGNFCQPSIPLQK